MARRQSRSRVVRRERRRRERERLRRRQIVDDMNEFLQSNTDVESFEEWEEALENPFDVESSERVFADESEAVEDMQRTFNVDEEERRRRYEEADRKRQETFRENYKTTSSQYSNIRDIFGTDVYAKLHEAFKLDSNQMMEIIMGLPSDVSSKDIEFAMEQLWKDLGATGNGARLLDDDAIIQAMEMGFSYEEAIFLTQPDREYAPISEHNIAVAIDDYIRSHLAQQEMERRTRENIRRRYAESVRGRI